MNEPLARPQEPDEFLEASKSAVARGNFSKAIALALQGQLRLQIIQHLQVHGMMEQAQQAERIAEEEKVGAPNPTGECEAGHENITTGCEFCAEDAKMIDTVEVQSKHDD